MEQYHILLVVYYCNIHILLDSWKYVVWLDIVTSLAVFWQVQKMSQNAKD